MSKTVGIVQARMSSSRFPGKVVQPLCGLPMIVFMLRRVSQSKLLDEVILATSTDISDEPLAEVAKAYGFSCYRGSLGDVLERFYGAAQQSQADVVVRMTGDCPLLDADIVDAVVEKMQTGAADYATNTLPPTYPDGLDVEAFTFASLERAYKEARLLSEREHVTPYMRNHPELFKIANVLGMVDCSHLRWTVDYPDDFEFVGRLLDFAGVTQPLQGDRYDFLRVLEHYPEILELNHHQRNEGYAKSVAHDQAIT